MSQDDFARLIQVDRRTTERWEAGRQGIRGRNVLRIAEALGQPAEVIRAHLSDERRRQDGPEDSGPVPGPRLQTGQQGDLVVAAGFGPQLVATLDQYAAVDNVHGPVGLIPPLVQQTNYAIDLIKVAPHDSQSGLIYAAARLAEFTGWLYQDEGDPGAAMRWTNAGLDLATEAADRYLVAYMWMRKANVALDARRPTMALDFAREAGQRAEELTPKLRASNARVEAQALAMIGDSDGSARAIDAALVGAAEPFDDEVDLAVYCTTEYVEMEAANCWLELGRPEAALDQLTAEVDAWDPRFRRDRAMSLARLAQAQVQAGDTFVGMKSAVLAADANQTIRSGRVRGRLDLVLKAHHEQGGDEELARELRSLLVVPQNPLGKEIVKSWI